MNRSELLFIGAARPMNFPFLRIAVIFRVVTSSQLGESDHSKEEQDEHERTVE